jgi:release factor glutamine methyltransferase
MKLKEVLDRTTQFFKEKKMESPRLDAELLLVDALKLKSRVDLYMKFDQPLAEKELNIAREFVRRRSLGEPVAYILGYRDFYKSRFFVTPAVLIPRPETEILVEEAVEWTVKNKLPEDEIKIIDLGTGSGCLGISVALDLIEKGYLKLDLTLMDISEEALKVAKKNCEHLLPHTSVNFILADASQYKPSQRFDLILANPPYIASNDVRVEPNVKKFEPELALFSAEEGYYAIRTWSEAFSSALAATGFMGFEIGCDQGSQVQNIFRGYDVFSEVRCVRDLSKLDRHVVGIKRTS